MMARSKRSTRPPHPWLLIGLIAIVALGTVVAIWSGRSIRPLIGDERTKLLASDQYLAYTHLLDSYSLLVPKTWTIEDGSDAHRVFFGPSGTLAGGTEREAYEAGGVSIEFLHEQFSNTDGLKQFVRETVEPKLRERQVVFTVSHTRLATYSVERLTTTAPERLTQDIINGPMVVVIAYQHRPTYLPHLVASLQTILAPTNSERVVIDQTNQFFADLKQGQFDLIYARMSPAFQEKVKQASFEDQLRTVLKGREKEGGLLISAISRRAGWQTRSVLVDPDRHKQTRISLGFVPVDGAVRADALSISDEQPSNFADLVPSLGGLK